jgi:hypothetical protein
VKQWKVGKITEEQMNMPCQEIWTGSTLVERIEQAWTWASCYGSWAPAPNHEAILPSKTGVPDTGRQLNSQSSRPSRVEYYFYFPSKDAADRAAAELRADHLSVDVQPSAMDDGKWVALASHSVAPGEPAIADFRDKFEDLAAKYGGQYDGWQAEVAHSTN